MITAQEKNLRVLMVSGDRWLVEDAPPGNSQDRHAEYGKYVHRLDIIVQCKKNDHHSQRQLAHNVTAYPTNSSFFGFYIFDTIRLFGKLLSQNTYDLIITQDPFLTGFAGILLKRKLSKPLLVHLHGDFFGSPLYQNKKLRYRIMFLFASFVIPRAEFFRVMSSRQKTILSNRGVPDKKIRVLPTPVNLTQFLHSHNKSLTFPWKKTLLMNGRIDAIKDFDTLFSSMKIVFENNKEVGLVLIGNYTDNSHVPLPPERVRLMGRVSYTELPQYYYASDVFVLSSVDESFGKVMVEALATGTPVVTTATSGALDIVKDGETGYVVPLKDAGALAEKILYLLSHPETAKRMGANGRNDVQKRFSHNTENIIGYWYDIVNSKQ